jgi:hypothetical protein
MAEDGCIADLELRATVARLDEAIRQGRTRREMIVWRGNRSAEQFLGGRSLEVGTVIPAYGYLATSVSRAVSVREYSAAAGGRAAAAPSARAQGVPAAWVATAGNPALARQGELLFAPEHSLRILRVSYDGESQVVDVGLE